MECREYKAEKVVDCREYEAEVVDCKPEAWVLVSLAQGEVRDLSSAESALVQSALCRVSPSCTKHMKICEHVRNSVHTLKISCSLLDKRSPETSKTTRQWKPACTLLFCVIMFCVCLLLLLLFFLGGGGG